MHWFTSKQVATLLSLQPYQISRLIQTGGLRAINISVGRGRATYRISQQAIDEFLKLREVGVKPAPVSTRPKRTRKTDLAGVTKYF